MLSFDVVVPIAVIFELIAEFLVELILGPLIEFLFQTIARALRIVLSRLGRGTLWLRRLPLAVDVVLTAASFGLGIWWGSYSQSAGQEHLPVAMWSLLAACIISAVLALTGFQVRSKNPVLRIDRQRWIRFAVLNAAGAAGVAIGFL